MEQKPTQYQMVSSMNAAFGNPKGDPDNIDWDRIRAQCRNIKDELQELSDAWLHRNMYNVRDALCDIKVFAFGAFHLMGIDYDDYAEAFEADLATIRERITLLTITPYDAYDALMSEDIGLGHASPTANSACAVLANLILATTHQQNMISGVDEYADMRAVINGVMTRFIKDDADKEATIAKHAAKGVTEVYFEGEYPTMIMKSAVDQPDAPKGKFLKSASFREPIFDVLD